VDARASYYLRLSVTDACNLRCSYCRPQSFGRGAAHRVRALADDQLVELVAAIDAVAPLRKVRLTGGEPLLRPRLPELVSALRAALPRAELALTTNGTLLARLARPLREAGLGALNVSLDTVDDERFRALAGGRSIAPIVEGLRAARAAGFERVKLNAVLLRSANGDGLVALVRLAAELGCDEIRFIELMPLGPAARIYAAEHLPAAAALARLRGELAYLGAAGRSGTALRHRFEIDGRSIVVGLIAPVSSPFCDGCDRLRLDAGGRLHACLRHSDGAPLAGLGREALRAAALRVLGCKVAPGLEWPERAMVAIGG
jgi:cyclic pyranopterin phosphate synthase